MNRKKIVVVLVVLLALAQVWVVASMILAREDVLKRGKEFKFKTAPVDPTDPFRGKYVTLQFEQNEFTNESDLEWKPGEEVILNLSSDADGFTIVQSFSKTIPSDGSDYLIAKSRYQVNQGTIMNIDYPFERFYMEESKAPEAEQIYDSTMNDTTQVTYALVAIKDGEAVVKDVLVNGISIQILAAKQLEKEEKE